MGRRNRRNSFSGKTDEEARKAQDQWARGLAKACNIKGDDAGRFRGVANVGRLETNADVSCARWTPAGRVRCRGKVERRLADCVAHENQHWHIMVLRERLPRLVNICR